MIIPNTTAHLTYCQNVYPVKTLEDIEENVFSKAALVKQDLSAKGLASGRFCAGLGADGSGQSHRACILCLAGRTLPSSPRWSRRALSNTF